MHPGSKNPEFCDLQSWHLTSFCQNLSEDKVYSITYSRHIIRGVSVEPMVVIGLRLTKTIFRADCLPVLQCLKLILENEPMLISYFQLLNIT